MSAFDVSPTRLRIKKVARRLAIGLGRTLNATGATGARCDGSVRVLTYHRFGQDGLDPCCLDPQSFEMQLEWLSEHANVLSPEQFSAAMSGVSRAPPDSVLITIDDGHWSVASHALPALDRRGFKALLFVCPLLVPAESDGERPDPDLRFMNWNELASAASGGHTIAPHGYSHRSLGRLPLAQAILEIEQARSALQTHLGVHGPFFSFPFGTRADHSEALAFALAERGFRYCFTASHGRCLPRSQSVLLPRIKIEGGNERDLFPHIVRGCIDHWRFIDHTLYFLQQRGRM